MAHIIEINNPFEPQKDTRSHVTPGGLTVRAWLVSTYPGFVDFDRPTLCIVNGNALLRAEWDKYEIKENDVINFVVLPGVNFLIAAFYVLLIASVAYAVYMLATMPKPIPE